MARRGLRVPAEGRATRGKQRICCSTIVLGLSTLVAICEINAIDEFQISIIDYDCVNDIDLCNVTMSCIFPELLRKIPASSRQSFDCKNLKMA